MTDWQPIETAPVGVRILAVWRPVDHEARPFHREIVIGNRGWNEEAYEPDGSFYMHNRSYDEATHITHWMPLPEAPK